MKTRTLTTMSLCAWLAVTFAYAQLPSQRLNVPFKFTAGSKVLPAGQYELIHEAGPAPWVQIRNAKDGSTIKLPIITRLARDTKSDTVKLVFDKVGDEHFLSEVWMPDQDGLLVRSTKEQHQHEILKASQ